jgi:hypothetical protein
VATLRGGSTVDWVWGWHERGDGRPEAFGRQASHKEVPGDHSVGFGRHLETSTEQLAFQDKVDTGPVNRVLPIVERPPRIVRRISGDVEKHLLGVFEAIRKFFRHGEELLRLIHRDVPESPCGSGCCVSRSGTGILHQPQRSATGYPANRFEK